MGREAGLGLFLVLSGPTRRGRVGRRSPRGTVEPLGVSEPLLGRNRPFPKQGGALQVIPRSILFAVAETGP